MLAGWCGQVPENIDDAYFVKAKEGKTADKEGAFFGDKKDQKHKGGEGLSAEKKDAQKVRPASPRSLSCFVVVGGG